MSEYGCKVCRVLDARGMADYESQLVAHWNGERGQRKGYRQLAEWLNVTMLRREIDRAGLSTLGNEAESKYERLQSDPTIAEEVRTALRTAGVPIDDVESDFVSYGVVRTHLVDCLGEEYTEESTDWEPEAIEIAREHATTKITEAVSSATSKGTLEAVGDVSVDVSVELECDETHVTVPIDRALRRGYVSKPRDDEETQGSNDTGDAGTDEERTDSDRSDGNRTDDIETSGEAGAPAGDLR
ncbi:rod-determining factor RdfA [Halovivax limisalsi]|uniref:rod-determining factor RdfA n=1 Tax=Halovivax limisalsi TaxID=1453760 RepID=UPI001FFC777A|nr:rod-determining factor RdfA [Halovivax limisalsi]